jgi:hydrogenase expression/formation protein HypC
MCLGIPARVIEPVGPDSWLAEIGGGRREIDLRLLADEPIEPGDWVFVHLGFAMGRLTEDEARESLETLTLLAEPGPDGDDT